MNDSIAIAVANRGDQRRQVQHIAANQRQLRRIEADGAEQSLIERNVEDHRSFAALEQHLHRIGADQAGTARDEYSLFRHKKRPSTRSASTISKGILSQRERKNNLLTTLTESYRRRSRCLDGNYFSRIMAAGASKS